ncbi:4Fe-4S dicluster domain-containing protein [Streptomyces sp. NPDC048664]|uniref:4Fe-4S dicluster domain-containing protein n=1 Tax=Streptomyces sp. NPDC048664 TaxID=3154505 RepID=UPI003419D490
MTDAGNAGAALDGQPAVVLHREALHSLVRVLKRRGRTVIGPTVRDQAIVLGELESGDDLPHGWGVELDAGRYRIRRRVDTAVFAHSAGPQSWKPFLHPQRVRRWTADRDPDGEVTVHEEEPQSVSYAFLGVRPCDLRAIRILDRVMIGGRFKDPAYGSRRAGAFLIAVECTEPGATCFCVSMGSGPAVDMGYDLALTEVLDDAGHRFLCRSGSEEGSAVLAELPRQPADDVTRAAAVDAVRMAAERMGRAMPPVDLRTLMRDTLEADRWDDVTARCLNCGNCTMVCPTCFCTTTEDVSDLSGDHAERWSRWDSCYDLDFTRLHDGPVRASQRSRYRQWLTHKIGTWHDQFDSTGCVGCGRCIVWCPTGIDLTEEVHALHREATQKGAPG